MHENKRSQIMFHLALPLSLVVLFFINAALPKTVLGCANRGWVALGLAGITVLAAFYTVIQALRISRTDRRKSTWWIISTVILMTPTIALLFLG